jgi:hypothetical protein
MAMLKSLLLLFLMIATSVTILPAQRVVETDVFVYGGTSAGVIAAYTARKLGKKAILAEPGMRLGGMTSGGLGYTDIGNKYAITGLARDFYRRTGAHYGKLEQWIFEPRVAEALFQDYVKRADLEVLYQSRLKDVRKEGNRVTSVVLEHVTEDGATDGTVIRAKMFIDCTYEGDLMAGAGVTYTVGREDNKDYNEAINGVQLQQGHQFPDGVDPYRRAGDASSGLLWGISDGTLHTNGTGDRKVQAYNYRICLTNDPANMVKITRPEGYDSTKYELLLRLFEATPEKRTLNDYFIWSRMPNSKTDINNRGGFSTDMIGMNYDYPDGSYDVRKRILRDHEAYTRGLLYFYGHDERVPEPLRSEMLQWGYPRDEYVENGHWSPQLYIREARRMVGGYVMSQANCEGRASVSDGVGMAAYTMDSHNCQRIVVNGQVKNEGNVEVGGFGPYPISYRSLIPREAECSNIFVPVCLSATHIAYGSIRMEPVFMVLAQSAATAAVMAIDDNVPVQQVNVSRLQRELKTNPLADGSSGDVLVDDGDGGVHRSGEWSVEKTGGYGPTFLIAESGGDKTAHVRFSPTVPKKGRYKVYVYFPKVEGLSDSTMVTVHNGRSSREVMIKESDIRVEGQTSGEWVYAGSYELPKGSKSYVEISTKSARGKVVADAVLWVPQTLGGQ